MIFLSGRCSVVKIETLYVALRIRYFRLHPDCLGSGLRRISIPTQGANKTMT
jgi:hypothetical protein